MSTFALAQFMHWDAWGWFWMALIMIFGVIIVVLLIFLITRTAFRSGDGDGRAEGETPLEIANRRYAADEISQEEFENIKRDLGKSGP